MLHFPVPVALLLALMLAALPAQAMAAEPDERIQSILVYGDDPCPVSDDGSIVVCARKPESERYRIPKALRKKPEVVESQSWGSRVQTLDTASRAVLPNSCSAIGTNGATGCSLAVLHQWYLERQLDGQSQPAH